MLTLSQNVVLTGIPADDDVGVNDVNLTLSDTNGDQATQNFQIRVTNANDAPTASSFTVVMDEDSVKTFSASEFNFADVDGDAFHSLIITSSVSKGVLALDGVSVVDKQVITDISKLTYTPNENSNGEGYASFSFKVSDSELNSTSAYNVGIDVSAVNDPILIDSTPITSVTRDQKYTYSLSSQDIDLDEGIWSVAEGYILPSWLTLQSGLEVTTIAEDESDFTYPQDVVTDTNGNIYVADTVNNQIVKVDSSGVITVIAGNDNYRGYKDGNASESLFFRPTGITIDTQGNLFIADYANHAIRKIDVNGTVSTVIGNGVDGNVDGNITTARISYPNDVVFDKNGVLYILCEGTNQIKKLENGILSTFTGHGDGYVDGNATTAQFSYGSSIAFNSLGDLYLTDRDNCKIRKIDVNGTISTFAGNSCEYIDGNLSIASFDDISGIVFDADDTMYITDKMRIRKITKDGIVSTIAGDGSRRFLDAIGLKAQFRDLEGLAIDNNGRLYVTDSSNHQIRTLFPESKLYGTPSVDDIGEYEIKIKVEDGNGGVDYQTFNISVAWTLSSISRIIEYMDFEDIHIGLNVQGVDTDTLTYSLTYDEALVDASISGDVLTLKSLSGVAGSSDINITVSDANSSTTRIIPFQVLSLTAGNTQSKGEVAVTDENGVESVTFSVSDDNLSANTTQTQTAGASQEVSLNGVITSAVSELLAVEVDFTSEGVKMSYEKLNEALLEVVATLKGETLQSTSVDGVETQTSISIVGASSEIKEDTQGNALVLSTVTFDDKEIVFTSDEEGHSKQVISNGTTSSTFLISIAGAQNSISQNGETTSIISGIKAIISSLGTISIDFLNNEDVYNFAFGTDLEILSIDNATYVKGTLELADEYIVE